MPIITPSVKSLLHGRLVVQVRVTVDATGKVIKAESLSHGLVHEAILQTALRAALLWKFEPARRDDHPLPSEARVEFIYH